MSRRRRVFLLFAKVATVAALVWWGLPWLVPLPQSLSAPLDRGQRFLASDGTPLRHLLNDQELRVGEPVDLLKAPDALAHATLAAEDQRFFQHGGVDLLAVLRAVKDRVSGGAKSGASTLTMQLVKVSANPPRGRTLAAKILECLQARRLEMTWSKERIMGEYLDRVSYGNRFTGITAASRGYFSKPVSDLTAAECALLAALPQAPSRLNPFRDRTAARPRQEWILERMKELGWLDKAGLVQALGQQLVLQPHHGGFTAPHAVELAKLQSPATGTVRTTIDSTLQRGVERIVQERLSALKARGVEHAAVVVIENKTGAVRALVGSRDFRSEEGGQINGAWEPRSPGSTVKPFTYAMAMDQAGSPASIVPDLPLEFQTPTGLYKPENYDGRSYGPITWRLALGNSFNLSAVRVLQSAGGEKRLAKLLTSLGISTLTQEPEHYGLGLTIGNAPVRLLELTQAYSCLARMGWSQSWTLLADSVPQPAERIFSESTAWLISDILSDNAARVITFGQNSVLRLPFRAAVKTGTSTNYRDNWCLGYVPEFTVGVWAGNFQGQPMQDVSGVTGAGPIWRDVMLKLKSQHQITWFKEPLGLERGRIDLRTGKRLTLQQGPVKHSRTEIWKKDQAPPQAARSDYETRTQRAILPPIYASWIKSPDNWLGDSVTTDESARFQPLSITAPTDGLVILDGTRLLLETLPADGVQWISDTVKIELDQGRAWAVNLRKGKHVLVARRGEARAKVSFEVK